MLLCTILYDTSHYYTILYYIYCMHFLWYVSILFVPPFFKSLYLSLHPFLRPYLLFLTLFYLSIHLHLHIHMHILILATHPSDIIPFLPLFLSHSFSLFPVPSTLSLLSSFLFTRLRRKAESIFHRFSELTKRPAAIKKALDMLTDVRSKVDSWAEKMPQVSGEDERWIINIEIEALVLRSLLSLWS